MKFTAQEEYGLRCLIGLARSTAAEQDFQTVSSIAAAEGLSVQYAGKLFRILARADLVESVRGCKGGYRLRLPPEEISVGAVLAALGGKMYEPQLCDRFRGDRQFCVHSSECSVRSLWSGLQLVLDAILDRTSVADLLASEKSVADWMRGYVEVLLRLVDDLDKPAEQTTSSHTALVSLSRIGNGDK